MYVALCRVTMERGVQLDLGEGPIKWVQCPNPAGTIGPASRTLDHTYALLCTFCSQLYFRQLKVIHIVICRGTVTHRTRWLKYKVELQLMKYDPSFGHIRNDCTQLNCDNAPVQL